MQISEGQLNLSDPQFMESMFDAVVDKGGLDALMEPVHGQNLGSQYLSEVILSS